MKDKNQRSKDRFITTYKEGDGITAALKAIIVDRATGVNYLYVQAGNSTTLTPLLNADGKPVVTEMIDDDKGFFGG